MNIRQATVNDAKGIAKVHIDSWRTTYEGIIDPQFLSELSYEEREQMWAEGLETSQPVFVAVTEAGDIVGFATGGEERTGKYSHYTGEVYVIYLLKAYQGQGIGRQLIQAVTQYIYDLGHTSMLIWVLQDNPAIYFYEALGGVKVATERLTIGRRNHIEIAYGWQSILPLLNT